MGGQVPAHLTAYDPARDGNIFDAALGRSNGIAPWLAREYDTTSGVLIVRKPSRSMQRQLKQIIKGMMHFFR